MIKWVKVKDELPESGRKHIVATSEDGEYRDWTVAYYDCSIGWILRGGTDWIGKITHWAYVQPPEDA